MTQILSDLDLQYRDGRTWKLIADFVVHTDTAGVIDVPAGFVTDFNSIPRPLWSILPPDDYGEAAVAHDWLYRQGTLRGNAITRDVADRVHRELTRFRHAPGWKVTAMYDGIRVGGWLTWRRYRNADTVAA